MFALGAGMAALRWILAGHGFDITAGQVLAAAAVIEETATFLGKRELKGSQLRNTIANLRN
jgi:hypothetical protein